MWRQCILFGVLLIKIAEPMICGNAQAGVARGAFMTLANMVMAHDHDMKETCKHFVQFAAREVFGANAFRLEILLPEYGNAAIDIKVIHRVIYVSAHVPRQGQQCDLTYGDIKVLPRFADTHKASYTYKDGTLIIAFPYKYRIEEVNLSCYDDIDPTLINVRRGFPNDPVFSDEPL